jgi:hypothetical protein
MNPRPRKLFKLLLFLFAGAIINVAVAWGCVYCHIPHHVEDTALDSQRKQWWVESAPQVMAIPHRQWIHSGFGVRNIWFVGYPDDSIIESAACVNAGFPVLSLHGAWFSGANANSGPGSSVGSVRLQGHSDYELFPYLPLFPGFAINTIFYAAIVWLLFFAPGAIRRRVRRKRGQCAACGYSLRGHGSATNVCPECGATACVR